MPLNLDFAGTDFDDVRALIDIDLTAHELPDATIQRSVFEGEAARIVTREVAALSDADQTANQATLKTAAFYLCASKIAPRVREIVSSRVNDDQMTYAKRDYAQLAKELESEGFEIISEVIDKVEGGGASKTVALSVFRTVPAGLK